MNSKARICGVGDVPPGSIASFSVGGRQIAVANVGGEFFAIDDLCTHKQCSLGSEGALDGDTVICGCHGAMYDVRTGMVKAPPAPRDVSTYVLKKEGNDIFIEL